MRRKPLVAEQRMKEFDPECERHFPLLLVKAVDPGCTLEIQIENAVTGEVARLTTTEDPARDLAKFLDELRKQFVSAFTKFELPADAALADLRKLPPSEGPKKESL